MLFLKNIPLDPPSKGERRTTLRVVLTDVGYTHNPGNVGEPNSKPEARNPKQARIPKIQMTETRNEVAYTVVAPGFHAGRASKPKTPGVEAGRYNV
jgi:hypothetical protein